jgi:membrane associated rhomboid family serine protease
LLLPFPENRVPAISATATRFLIAITAAVSLVQIAVTRNGTLPVQGLAHILGVVPARINPVCLITYTFIHADIAHLILNMGYLLVFGAGVEAALGRVRFLGIYVTGGALGALLQTLVARHLPLLLSPGTAILGASAACSALMGVYAVRYYRDRILFVGIPYRPTVIELVTAFLTIDIGAGIWQIFTGQSQDGIAHWAHVGGFVFGLCAAYLLKQDDRGTAAYWKQDAAAALNNSLPGAAIQRLERLIERTPGCIDERLQLADAWLQYGDQEQAAAAYLDAIRVHASAGRRNDAARAFQELRSLAAKAGNPDLNARWNSPLMPDLSTAELYTVGLALEERGSHADAAEALRAVSVRDPGSAEAETALLRVITMYFGALKRAEEAHILAQIFLESYPDSPLRTRAKEMLKQAAGLTQG